MMATDVPEFQRMQLGAHTIEFVRVPAQVFSMGLPRPVPPSDQMVNGTWVAGWVILASGSLWIVGHIAVALWRRRRVQFFLGHGLAFMGFCCLLMYVILMHTHYKKVFEYERSKYELNLEILSARGPNDTTRFVHGARITKDFYLASREVSWGVIDYAWPDRELFHRIVRGKSDDLAPFSWVEAEEACKRLTAVMRRDPARQHWTLRLPTEAEWELAATLVERPVEPNLKGVVDMVAGGFSEWCQDAYDRDFYKNAPAQDPVRINPDSSSRVHRGAARNESGAVDWCHKRRYKNKDFQPHNIGIRLVLECPATN